MITEKELQEAIAECQGQRNPNANTCLKLASYYTILDHLNEKPEGANPEPAYSFSVGSQSGTVEYFNDSEFARTVYGMKSEQAWQIMDELMETLFAINPSLYRSVIRKLKGEQT